MNLRELDFIDLIYEAAAEPETGWNHLVNEFGKLFPETKTVLGTYDQGEMCVSRSASDLELDTLSTYAAHFAAINPVVPPLLESRPNTYFDADDLVDRKTFLNSEVWNDFWLPNGELQRNVGIVLENENGLFSTFCTHYPDIDDRRENHQAPGQLIKVIAPHLQRALRIQERIEKASGAATTLLDMLDGNGQAAFLVKAGGRIVEQNDTAERLLRAGSPLRLMPGGKLALTESTSDTLFQSALHVAFGVDDLKAAGRAGTSIPARTGDGDFYRVNVGPSVGSIQANKGFAIYREKYSLVTVEALGRIKKPDPGLIATAFELTPAETKLAMALFDGSSIAEFSARNGINVQTARNQLRSVFAKAGVGRQAELVSLLSKFT